MWDHYVTLWNSRLYAKQHIVKQAFNVAHLCQFKIRHALVPLKIRFLRCFKIPEKDQKDLKRLRNTVDGTNPAPVDMVNIPLFTNFNISQVVQEFFHQQ